MKSVERRQIAHDLYMMGISNVRLAAVLEVNDNTISNWAVDGNWREKRNAMLSSQKNRVERLSGLLDYQLEAFDQRIKINRHDSPDLLPTFDMKEIGALMKMFGAVKGDETNFATLVKSLRKFMQFISKKNPELAKTMVPYLDDYLVDMRSALSTD